MYTNFYGLRADPFRLSPDHNFCFRHASFSKAKAYMQYALHREEGFVVITGGPGTGKTTLIGDLLSEHNQSDFDIARLVSAQLEGDDLLRMVSHAFRVPVNGTEKSETLNHLHRYVTDIYKRKRRPLLIIDEAQGLGREALEELRLLTNLQIDGQPLLQIFLVGQSELRDLILDPTLEQLHQRIVAACHLETLKPQDTASYVMHRLKCTGWIGMPMIDIKIFPELFNFSRGIPRRINLACSRLLLHGSLEEKVQLDVSDIKLVVEELREEDLSPGNPSAVVKLGDFDLAKLHSLVQPDKPRVNPPCPVPETPREVSQAVVCHSIEEPAAPPVTRQEISANLDLEPEKRELVSLIPDDKEQENRISLRVVDTADRKKLAAKSPSDLSTEEVFYPRLNQVVNQDSDRHAKDVEDASNSRIENFGRPEYSKNPKRLILVNLVVGLVLTGGILLTAPAHLLHKVATDTTWSELGVNQARDVVSRLSGGIMPTLYESEPKHLVVSDLETLKISRERPIIEHRPISRDLTDTESDPGHFQPDYGDLEQAIPLPVKAADPTVKIVPRNSKPTAEETTPANKDQEPGEHLIETNLLLRPALI